MHMRNLDLIVINQLKNHYNSMSLIVDEVIQDVIQFHNKQKCMVVIRLYHIENTLDYIILQYDLKKYVFKCVNGQCLFKLKTSYKKRHG